MRIEVVPYQSVWPELFRDIEAKLQDESCGVSVIAIEHVGSTSIPGLPAKPIKITTFLLLEKISLPELPLCNTLATTTQSTLFLHTIRQSREKTSEECLDMLNATGWLDPQTGRFSGPFQRGGY